MPDFTVTPRAAGLRAAQPSTPRPHRRRHTAPRASMPAPTVGTLGTALRLRPDHAAHLSGPRAPSRSPCRRPTVAEHKRRRPACDGHRVPGLRPPRSRFSPTAPEREYGRVLQRLGLDRRSEHRPNHRQIRLELRRRQDGSGVTVTHRFSAPGTYNVVLTVTDDVGVTDEQSTAGHGDVRQSDGDHDGNAEPDAGRSGDDLQRQRQHEPAGSTITSYTFN